MNGESKKILIVDDDKFLREMYVSKFSNSGFEVSSAGSAKEAIDLIQGDFKPDILLFDVIMPMEDGWELIKQIQNSGLIPDTKKIVLSNQGEEEDKEIGQQYNVDGYIVKALNTPSEVVKKVQSLTS